MITKCSVCSIEFKHRPSVQRKYCSNYCAKKGKIGIDISKITTKCLICNTEFKHIPSVERKYCSYNCYRKSRIGIDISKITTKCLICNTEFKHIPSVERKYCSNFCYGQSIVKNDLPKFTVEQLDMINGLLLGDGCIAKNKNNNNLSVKQSNREYLEHIFEALKPYSLAIDKGKCGKIISACFVNGKRKLFHNKNEFDTYYSFRASSHPTFTEFRKIWYPNNIKIVPEDINLNPITLANWYMGDGSHTPSVKSAYFATDSFDGKSIEVLRSKLDSINLANFIVLHYQKPRIYLSAKSYSKFMEIIRPFMCEYFTYKLPLESKCQPSQNF